MKYILNRFKNVVNFVLLFELVFIACCILSCSMDKMVQGLYGHHYKYRFELIRPKQDSTLVFEDNSIKIDFTFREKEIDFIAKNNGNEPIRVIWDDAAFVQEGKTEKIMHKGIKYIDRNNSMSPTVIPPGSSLDDMIVPTSNIYWKDGSYSANYSRPGDWETKDMFIFYDLNKKNLKELIPSYQGDEVSIYLPIRNSTNQEIGYTFKFKIKAIECINCKAISKS